MDRQPFTPADGPAAPHLLPAQAWAFVLAGLLAWQSWMTLSLFAPRPEKHAEPASPGLAAEARAAWSRLRNDEPIVSGQHPLHLYFGYLGAEALADRSTLCCY